MRIRGQLRINDVISLSQFDQKSLLDLFKKTQQIIKLAKIGKSKDLLKGSVIALLFFEPSTRTFNSFSSAAQRLGAGVISLQDLSVSSMVKGETFEDTIQMFSGYAEAIVIRHPEIGSAQRAADVAEAPVINAGDGIGEHPTQGLLDVFTIYEKFGRLDRLTGVVAGDLLNGRTLHSLLQALAKFKRNEVYLLSPQQLRLDKSLFSLCARQGLKLLEIHNEQQIPEDADFWYWTRIQKERFKNIRDYKKVQNSFILSSALLKKKGNKKMIVMHPLPRVNEITTEVDADPRAYYFKQAKNGLFMRMALLATILKKL